MSSSIRIESLPCLSNKDIAVKRLEKDFLSATIDIPCNTVVDLDAELSTLGPFVLDDRCARDPRRLGFEVTVNLAVAGVHLHRGLKVRRKRHVDVAIQRTERH